MQSKKVAIDEGSRSQRMPSLKNKTRMQCRRRVETGTGHNQPPDSIVELFSQGTKTPFQA